MSQSEDIKAAARRALAPIAEDMLEVERIIMREVSSAVSRVDEVGHYITAAGGKRMRPALLILMARAMGAYRRLGEPLPHQLANTTHAHL